MASPPSSEDNPTAHGGAKKRRSFLPAPKTFSSRQRSPPAESFVSPLQPSGETTTRSSLSPSDPDIGNKELKVGDRVTISGVKPGVLQYFGHTHFADGIWCGIALDDPDGKHGGEVEGVRYFTCADYHGIFAPATKVQLEVVTVRSRLTPTGAPSGIKPPGTRMVQSCHEAISTDLTSKQTENSDQHSPVKRRFKSKLVRPKSYCGQAEGSSGGGESGSDGDIPKSKVSKLPMISSKLPCPKSHIKNAELQIGEPNREGELNSTFTVPVDVGKNYQQTGDRGDNVPSQSNLNLTFKKEPCVPDLLTPPSSHMLSPDVKQEVNNAEVSENAPLDILAGSHLLEKSCELDLLTEEELHKTNLLSPFGDPYTVEPKDIVPEVLGGPCLQSTPMISHTRGRHLEALNATYGVNVINDSDSLPNDEQKHFVNPVEQRENEPFAVHLEQQNVTYNVDDNTEMPSDSHMDNMQAVHTFDGTVGGDNIDRPDSLQLNDDGDDDANIALVTQTSEGGEASAHDDLTPADVQDVVIQEIMDEDDGDDGDEVHVPMENHKPFLNVERGDNGHLENVARDEASHRTEDAEILEMADKLNSDHQLNSDLPSSANEQTGVPSDGHDVDEMCCDSDITDAGPVIPNLQDTSVPEALYQAEDNEQVVPDPEENALQTDTQDNESQMSISGEYSHVADDISQKEKEEIPHHMEDADPMCVDTEDDLACSGMSSEVASMSISTELTPAVSTTMEDSQMSVDDVEDICDDTTLISREGIAVDDVPNAEVELQIKPESKIETAPDNVLAEREVTVQDHVEEKNGGERESISQKNSSPANANSDGKHEFVNDKAAVGHKTVDKKHPVPNQSKTAQQKKGAKIDNRATKKNVKNVSSKKKSEATDKEKNSNKLAVKDNRRSRSNSVSSHHEHDGETPRKIVKHTPKSKWGNIMSELEASKSRKPKPKTEVKSKLNIELHPVQPQKPKEEKAKPKISHKMPDLSKVKSKLTVETKASASKKANLRSPRSGSEVNSRSQSPHDRHVDATDGASHSRSRPSSAGKRNVPGAVSNLELSGIKSSSSLSLNSENGTAKKRKGSHVSVHSVSKSTAELAEPKPTKRKSLASTRTVAPVKKNEPRRASMAVTTSSASQLASPQTKRKTVSRIPSVPDQTKPAPAKKQNTSKNASTAAKNSVGPRSATVPQIKCAPHQPDVVSNSLQRPPASQEIARLEALCEARTKELNLLKMQLKHGALGFEAMSVMVQYLTQELNAFSCPRVTAELQETRQRLEQTQSELDIAKKERQQLGAEVEELHVSHRKYVDTLADDHRQNVEQLEVRLGEEKETEVQRVIDQHSHEVTTLKNYHERHIAEAQTECQAKVDELKKKHEEELARIQKENSRMVEDIQQQHSEKLMEITMRFEEIKVSLSHKLDSLRMECDDLRARAKYYQEALERDTDHKVQVALRPYKDLPQEIDSLKLVLDMRNEEIRELRRENSEQARQLEELPFARDKITSQQQKIENLEAILDIRGDYEKQLSEKHQMLLRKYDRESKANKRLSMDNEELQYKLQFEPEVPESFRRQVSRSPPGSPGSPTVVRRVRSPFSQSPSGSDWDRSPKSPTNKSSVMRRSWSHLSDKKAKRKSGSHLVEVDDNDNERSLKQRSQSPCSETGAMGFMTSTSEIEIPDDHPMSKSCT